MFSSRFASAAGRSRLSICVIVGLLMSLPGTEASAQTLAWASDFEPAGLSGRVFATAVWNGSLVAGGDGFAVGGYPSSAVNHVAIWDGSAWKPLGGGVTGVLSLSAFATPMVSAVAVYGGELVVAGRFINAGGVVVNSIARWNGTSWAPLGSGLQDTSGMTPGVASLAVYNGELYAGGNFTLAGGQNIVGIAKWNGAQWSPVGGNVSGIYALAVMALKVHGNLLYAGGQFGQIGGVAASCIAAWNGTSWTAVGGGVPNQIAPVMALESFQGNLYAGGPFTGIGAVTSTGIASWNGTSWQALQGGVANYNGVGAQVASLQAWNGSLYVGGRFDSVNGQQCLNLARWDGTQWHVHGGVGGSATQSGVFAMSVFEGRLVVGGEFTRAGPAFGGVASVASNDLATFDGATWGQGGAGLGMDDEVYKLLHWNGGIVAVGRFVQAGMSASSQVTFFDGFQWKGLGTFDNSVYDATIWNGQLVVTGDFLTVNGVAAASVARFDGSQWFAMAGPAGGRCLAVYQAQLYAGGVGPPQRWTGSQWQPFGQPLFGSLEAMHVHAGKLYLGGLINSPSVGNLVSWDGAVMAPVGSGLNDVVEAITTYGSDLVVGGWFTAAGGTPASRVARWNGSGWSQLGPGLPGSVHAFAEIGGELYVGGDFWTWMGAPGNYAVRWNGTAFQPLGSGLDATVFTLLADPARNSVYAGGVFQNAGGIPSWRFARWGLPTIRAQFSQAGAGAPVSITHSNLTPGKEYFGVFSTEPAPAGVGTGPYAGLWSSDLNFLLSQVAAPLGAVPFHYVATAPSMTFGAWMVPPMTIETLLFEVNPTIVDSTSFAVRFRIQ